MFRKRFYYLVKIQYLGYRLHGWQKQPDVKTVEGLITKTLGWVMPHAKCKILGTSRTDAMVSAEESAFELFLDHEPLKDLEEFLVEFNKNLPQDIRALSIETVDEKFNIIQHSKTKEYSYLFSVGDKFHPFCAPFMANFQEDLDIVKMKKAAKLFQGKHNFKNYCVRVSENSTFEREMLKSELVENTEYTANFFPEQSYIFHIHAAGFLRHQVRLMMGSLVLAGRGELSLEDIENSLKPETPELQMDYIAPASGLILNKIEFE
ncbi:tRNA pseudouridine(38-40) synthase TruA [Christiangramia sabulilitoris]|uniref:tRNA pseudouridine synthase A n=1 Tax=Christiangramia sabulilitoris TaxID=2583991 RepID=A0A550I5Z0_9FLAO|nr:tRNA pseudouridine(38-40) synthase TruA [Christiangramia sabulilitoris]TRO66392.1 tRNA pseudouridine(38-40) synthase TruA [Christiangramia sabulilitoris]